MKGIGLVHSEECAAISHHTCLIDTSFVHAEILGLVVDGGTDGLAVFVETEDFLGNTVLLH